MNDEVIRKAINECDHKISDYEKHLEEMYPSFLYDYEDVKKLDDVLLNTLACRDMLMEMLKEGDEQ